MVLADTTSAYGVICDRATLTRVLFIRKGTSIVSAGWESIDSEFFLNIRAVRVWYYGNATYDHHCTRLADTLTEDKDFG